MVNNILAQTSKPELAQYLHAALFISTKTSLLKAIKRGFLKTWTGLTEKLTKKNIDKLCDDGRTITLDKQETSIKKNGEKILKGNIKKKGISKVPLGPQQ